MVMPASVIIVGGAVEPELSKPFNENDVLHNDAHASLEHTLAVVEVPEADVRRDPAEICVNVVHNTLSTAGRRPRFVRSIQLVVHMA